MVSKLESYKRPFLGIIYTDQKFCQYLMDHFSDWPNSIRLRTKASSVDPDKLVHALTYKRKYKYCICFLDPMSDW